MAALYFIGGRTMTQPAKKTDQHTVLVKTSSPGGAPVYGVNVYSVINPNTGEEVDRVEGLGNALAAQARENARVARNGQ